MWVGLEQAVTLRLWNSTVIFFSFSTAFLQQLSEMGHGGCVIVCLIYLKKKWNLQVK